MTYLIDGRSLQGRSTVRGIGTYLRGLLAGYAELGVAAECEMVVRNGDALPPEIARHGLRASRGHVPQVKRRLQPSADPFFMAALIRRLRPRLYHGVEYGQPITSPVPVVITVHDLIPFVFPSQYPWMRRERLLALRLLRRADALIADSHATARDLTSIAHADPARIHVVPLGVSTAYAPAADGAKNSVLSRYGMPDKPFVLAVGAFDPRKRIDLLATTFAALRRDADVELVIVGAQGAFDGPVRNALERAGVTAHTHLLGYVPETDLISLYARARALLFTSEYEGFGLPPLEAMAAGCPVVMFDNSSLPEVGGSAAVLVTDRDAAAMASAAALLCTDSTERDRRRADGVSWAAEFTWRRTAEQTFAVYTSLLGGATT